MNAAGTMLGPIFNNAGGVFNLTGALVGGTNPNLYAGNFANAAGGTVNLNFNTYSGLAAMTNAGTINVGNAVAGNTASGTAIIGAGNLTNSGVINLTNTGPVPAMPALWQVNRTLVVQGSYTGIAGSQVNSAINLDANFAGSQRAGALVIQGNSSGTTGVNLFNPGNTSGVILQSPITVISSGNVGSSLYAPETALDRRRARRGEQRFRAL